MDIIENFFGNSHIFLNFIYFVLGLVVLLKGSDMFIDSAVFFAKKFNISEIIIGLTLVSIGTSLPELATNVASALKGSTGLALGNVVGSNVTNIALVVGVSALMVGRLTFNKMLFYRDVPVMIGASVYLVIAVFFFDGDTYRINWIESSIMLCCIVVYFAYLVKTNSLGELEEEGDDEVKIKAFSIGILYFILGFIGIFAGSEVAVQNIRFMAFKLNISDGIIGATIVALGTSLPELAVSITGILKNKATLSLGNIIGSNIFNILGVLGITGLIRSVDLVNVVTGEIDRIALYFTVPYTLFIALLLMVFMRTQWKIGRVKGSIFIFLYIAFIYINFMGF